MCRDPDHFEDSQANNIPSVLFIHPHEIECDLAKLPIGVRDEHSPQERHLTDGHQLAPWHSFIQHSSVVITSQLFRFRQATISDRRCFQCCFEVWRHLHPMPWPRSTIELIVVVLQTSLHKRHCKRGQKLLFVHCSIHSFFEHKTLMSLDSARRQNSTKRSLHARCLVLPQLHPHLLPCMMLATQVVLVVSPQSVHINKGHQSLPVQFENHSESVVMIFTFLPESLALTSARLFRKWSGLFTSRLKTIGVTNAGMDLSSSSLAYSASSLSYILCDGCHPDISCLTYARPPATLYTL